MQAWDIHASKSAKTSVGALCSSTSPVNLASSISISGWQLSGEIVLGDVDSVCARGQLEQLGGQMAALCARFQSRRVPQYLTGTYFTICCALCPRATRSLPGGRPVLADAHPGTGHSAPRRDKQGTGCPLIVSQQMLLGITPRTIFRQPHSTVEKCDIGRTLGAINPSSSGGQLAFWSFSNSNPCRQNFCWNEST